MIGELCSNNLTFLLFTWKRQSGAQGRIPESHNHKKWKFMKQQLTVKSGQLLLKSAPFQAFVEVIGTPLVIDCWVQYISLHNSIDMSFNGRFVMFTQPGEISVHNYATIHLICLHSAPATRIVYVNVERTVIQRDFLITAILSKKLHGIFSVNKYKESFKFIYIPK